MEEAEANVVDPERDFIYGGTCTEVQRTLT